MCTSITQEPQRSAGNPSLRWWAVLIFSLRSDCFTTRLQQPPWWEVIGLWQACQNPFKHLAALEVLLEVEWNWCNATMASAACKAGNTTCWQKHNSQSLRRWCHESKSTRMRPQTSRSGPGCRRSCNLWDLFNWLLYFTSSLRYFLGNMIPEQCLKSSLPLMSLV